MDEQNNQTMPNEEKAQSNAKERKLYPLTFEIEDEGEKYANQVLNELMEKWYKEQDEKK